MDNIDSLMSEMLDILYEQEAYFRVKCNLLDKHTNKILFFGGNLIMLIVELLMKTMFSIVL